MGNETFVLQTNQGTGSRSNAAFVYFGNASADKGSDFKNKVLVYADKVGNEKPRQSRRSLDVTTLENMIRGTIGTGELGVTALAPYTDGKRSVFIQNFHYEGSPYRENFIAAARNVRSESETQALGEIPAWLTDAANAELAVVEETETADA